MKKYFIILTVVSLLALWPFFKKGYFESHDGEWMVIRFSAFHQTIAAGQFPVRFTDRLNNNYGYPVFNFLYPLPFYFAEIFKLTGFGFIDSVKITFIASTLASTVLMFWAISQRYSKEASFVASIFYLYVPYRFVDLYVRGSVGENFAFAILPLILGSIFKIADGKKYYKPILSISIGMLLVSHNVIAAIFLPIFVVISYIESKKHFAKNILFIILGILISVFFTVPALYDLHFVRLSQIKVSEINDHMSSIRNLLIPSWGYGSTPQGVDTFSPQLGIFTILALFASAYYLKKRRKTLNIFLIIISILSIILMLKVTLPVWVKVPTVDVIQFPWRLLSVIIFSTSILTASIMENFKNNKILIVSLTLLIVATNIIYTKPKNFVNKGDSYYSTNESTTTVRGEYLPLWVQKLPQERAYQKIILENGAEILNLQIKPSNYKATISSNEDSIVLVNTIFFPGHQVTLNGQKVNVNYTNQVGLINFKLPKGTHEVIIKYGKTPVHLTSEIISLIALFVTGVLFVYYIQKNSVFSKKLKNDE